LTQDTRARDDSGVKGSCARRTKVAGAGLAVSACIAVCAACGSRSSTGIETRERQFAANTASLIDQFHEDVTISRNEGGSVALARKPSATPQTSSRSWSPTPTSAAAGR
jgi:hypothetical protein